MRRLAVVAVVAAVLVAIVGAALGPRLVRREVLPARGDTVDFFEREVTWAQGSTLHHGDRSFDVSPLVVHALRPSRHGIFLQVSDIPAFEEPTRWVLFDGRRAASVPGDVDEVAVSPDGEHAGWIDREGPWGPAGRVAQVVVVDLRTGQRVLRTSEGMGGGWGDDLAVRYEELEPTFLGFDEQRAYWRDATGSGRRWRWDLTTHDTQRAERSQESGEAMTAPVGEPWDPQRGRGVWVADGRPVDDPSSGERGFLSPDGRYLVLEPVARVAVTRPADGSRVWLGTDRFAWFGGWLDETHLYALTRSHYEDGYDPGKPDRTQGALVTCALPSGRCATVTPVTGTRSVVLPGATHVF